MLARLALGRDLLGLVDDHVHVFVEALMKFFFETFLREFERGGLIGERAREGGARDAVEEESEAAAGRERASEEVERERRSKKGNVAAAFLIESGGNSTKEKHSR